LVISTPAATLSGLANAARHGILFKGGGHLEDAGLVRIVAFDKTGTLTEGRPRLTDIVSLDGGDEGELLRLAASAERLSEHRLAQAIVAAAGERGEPLAEPLDFRAVPGKGIVAVVDGNEVAVGNEALFAELGAAVDGAAAVVARLRTEGKTTMLVGDARGVRGVLAVADVGRPPAEKGHSHGLVRQPVGDDSAWQPTKLSTGRHGTDVASSVTCNSATGTPSLQVPMNRCSGVFPSAYSHHVPSKAQAKSASASFQIPY
ncbi:MAG TPA: HAD family hydrolase, partial [Thermomicrobiales bacterium]